MSPTGDGTDSSTSLDQRMAKAVPSLLSFFLSISTVTVMKPATSRSTLKRFTDFPWNTPIVGGKYTVQYNSFTLDGEYNKHTCK